MFTTYECLESDQTLAESDNTSDPLSVGSSIDDVLRAGVSVGYTLATQPEVICYTAP